MSGSSVIPHLPEHNIYFAAKITHAQFNMFGIIDMLVHICGIRELLFTI